MYGYLPEGIIEGKIPASADGKNRQGGIMTEHKTCSEWKESKELLKAFSESKKTLAEVLDFLREAETGEEQDNQ